MKKFGFWYEVKKALLITMYGVAVGMCCIGPLLGVPVSALEDDVKCGVVQSIQDYEASEGSEEGLIIESINTSYSDDAPCIISITLSIPDGFGLSAEAEVVNVETGITYRMPLYAVNGYNQRCYVPEGTYYISNITICDDVKNEYPISFPTEDFVMEANVSMEIDAKLANYDEVSEVINEKKGVQTADDYTPNTSFAIDHEGTGEGKVGITGTQLGRYEFEIKITQTGYLGDGHFIYSLNGGTTWSEDTEIPLSGFYEIDNTGLIVEFYVLNTDEFGFLEGDVYSSFIPDPSVRISYEHTGDGTAEVEVLSLDDKIPAFDALEASGMHICIKIEKTGAFSEAIWSVSTDGGVTYQPQTYATEEIVFEDAGFKLRFYLPNEKGVPFVRGAEYTITPVREGTAFNYTLIYTIMFAIVGIIGFAVYSVNKWLKSLIPTKKDYTILR